MIRATECSPWPPAALVQSESRHQHGGGTDPLREEFIITPDADLVAPPAEPLADPGANPDRADLLTRAEEVAVWCAAHAAAIDEEGTFPTEEFRRVAAAGLLTAPLRRELGGFGLGVEPGGTPPLLTLLRTFGWGNLSVGRLYEGHANALALIQTFGTAGQIGRAAADAKAGRLFAVWNTEGADGVAFAPIGGGRVRLAGAKTYASGAGHVARPLVTGALPDGGWQMAVVPIERAALAIDPASWRPLGMRASASYKVGFDGTELGPADLVGGLGDYYRQPWFGGGAIRFAAVQLGGGEALLDAARDDLRAAGRAGDPHQRTRIGRAAIAVEGGKLWLAGAAERADRSLLGGAEEPTVDAATMVAYANMTRHAIERVCLDVLELVERGVGARAMQRPHSIERIGRDLTLYLRQPAPDATLEEVGRYALASAASTARLWRP